MNSRIWEMGYDTKMETSPAYSDNCFINVEVVLEL